MQPLLRRNYLSPSWLHCNNVYRPSSKRNPSNNIAKPVYGWFCEGSLYSIAKATSPLISEAMKG
ncbi:unnamed protein product [Periconia digitata]|uniref:Uncharacterized protein n=1 Tax=Periconia digitata TaxID=1303443 RepID=A0A9W4UJ23_9PLEO|nr:unnamed protein product [Periconia digitata]